jgi:hypothetical protein
VGATERERAGRFGKRLVVIDQHADAPHRGVERLEAVTGRIDDVLAGGLMNLAVPAEDAVAA